MNFFIAGVYVIQVDIVLISSGDRPVRVIVVFITRVYRLLVDIVPISSTF